MNCIYQYRVAGGARDERAISPVVCQPAGVDSLGIPLQLLQVEKQY